MLLPDLLWSGHVPAPWVTSRLVQRLAQRSAAASRTWSLGTRCTASRAVSPWASGPLGWLMACEARAGSVTGTSCRAERACSPQSLQRGLLKMRRLSCWVLRPAQRRISVFSFSEQPVPYTRMQAALGQQRCTRAHLRRAGAVLALRPAEESAVLQKTLPAVQGSSEGHRHRHTESPLWPAA